MSPSKTCLMSGNVKKEPHTAILRTNTIRLAFRRDGTYKHEIYSVFTCILDITPDLLGLRRKLQIYALSAIVG